MKKPRIFMTAEEKKAEKKEQIKEWIAKVPDIVSKFEKTITSMEESADKVRQNAIEAIKSGMDEHMVNRMFDMAIKMKTDSLGLNILKKRLELCGSELERRIDDLSFEKMKMLEKNLSVFLNAGNGGNYKRYLSDIEKALFEVEEFLNIDTKELYDIKSDIDDSEKPDDSENSEDGSSEN